MSVQNLWRLILISKVQNGRRIDIVEISCIYYDFTGAENPFAACPGHEMNVDSPLSYVYESIQSARLPQ